MNRLLSNIEILREIALDQFGLVTCEQAALAGVSKHTLSKFVKREKIERVAHGVYRIPHLPVSHDDRLMQAILWTGADEAVISHETALAFYDVCDINPTEIHITVVKSRRISRKAGEGYHLHYITLLPEQMTFVRQIPAANICTAIAQCIQYGTQSHLILQALENAKDRGMILEQEYSDLRARLDERNAR